MLYCSHQLPIAATDSFVEFVENMGVQHLADSSKFEVSLCYMGHCIQNEAEREEEREKRREGKQESLGLPLRLYPKILPIVTRAA